MVTRKTYKTACLKYAGILNNNITNMKKLKHLSFSKSHAGIINFTNSYPVPL